MRWGDMSRASDLETWGVSDGIVQLIQALHRLFWPWNAPETREYRQNVEPFEVHQVCQQAFQHLLRD